MLPSLRTPPTSLLLLTTTLPLAGCLTAEKGPACYWMADSPPYDYQRAWWVDTLQQCYEQDSCSGGLGMSNGGCYKWADSADGDPYPWPGEDTADSGQEASVHVSGVYSYLTQAADGWLQPGETLVIYENDGGDLAECMLDESGTLSAHNHDRMSQDGPGTYSEPVTSGCTEAEEYGYTVQCCFD